MRDRWPRRRDPSPRWELVKPGERGEPADEFESFSFWVPSPLLKKHVVEEGRRSGEADLPDVTGSRPLPHPPGVVSLQEIVDDACGHCCQSAARLFEPIGRQISGLVAQGAAAPGEDEHNAARARRRHMAGLRSLEVLVGQMERLEDGLNLRLDRIVSHGNSLAAQLYSELLEHHSYAALVTQAYAIPQFVVDPEHTIFGQDQARAIVSELRNGVRSTDPEQERA